MLSPCAPQRQKKTSPESLAQGHNTGLHHHHEIQIMEFQMSVENTNSHIPATVFLLLKKNKKGVKRGCMYFVISKNTFVKRFSI